ncbi:aminoglycoside phosphotransferase family protein [Kutzneria sp. 744]|uniref:aminoglycoside phosphotransferase family protein n=1 Tax=Kutzneria sp. (strain 744) TaxID=345341 RepID=UPI0003EED9A8|nr:aminoglycoside phosphotransferase family protein [Kutzneria sp. 744]EWM16740.1 streptomycin 6-kinase [Kutzneria sp. 744]
MIDVPDAFAQATALREGEAGRSWLRSLPAIVDELLQRWSCVPAGSIKHGAVGIVLPVRRGDLAAVIKVSFPHPGNVDQPAAFAAWRGRGAVRLHERDDARFAMLLERAGPGTLAEVADDDRAVGILGELSRRLAVPAPPGLPRIRDEVAGWEAEILAAGSLPPRVVDAAVAALRELDHPETVVHGDLHDTNVLAAEREPWLAIDPKGLVGDPAYDAFTVIHSPRLLLTSGHLRALDIFCEAAGIDRERARRWALVRTVRSVLWDRRHGPSWLVEAGHRLIATLLD